MLLSLKNVSKFYYSKGVVTSGFSKVSLDLDRGEFVAITGESGSGKSTLLNVISGLDTYEEGEMYINGEETSAFTAKEFETYRRKYIANVFQSFNLVNSYTVYQNVALILQINGTKAKERRAKVEDALKKVGLWDIRRQKASRLSGGQKQRVAIARALVKETPIIVADEPTGNLDVESATEVMKLFSEVAKDRLVIIVTHNYEQVEPYVTRKIRMSDGRIVENLNIRPKRENLEEITSNATNRLSIFNKFRLGIRNTFNIVPKFVLLFLVFAFMTLATLGMFASYRRNEYENSMIGWNQYFQGESDKRIIIYKEDNSPISQEDFDQILKIDNIVELQKNDILTDTSIVLRTSDYSNYFGGHVKPIENFKNDLVIGNLPEAENEVVLNAREDDYLFNDAEGIIGKELLVSIDGEYGSSTLPFTLKIVGISNTVATSTSIWGSSYDFYLSEAYLNLISKYSYMNTSKIETLFQNKYFESIPWSAGQIVVNNNVAVGQAIMPQTFRTYCPNENCYGSWLKVSANNRFYQSSIDLEMNNYMYNDQNYNWLLGISKEQYQEQPENIYINQEDYIRLFNDNTYQSSVYIEDPKLHEETQNELEKLGYHTLYVHDTVLDTSDISIFGIMFRSIFMIVILVALFFISYFIIRLILRSRNTYYATLRMLGATKSNSNQLLSIELFTVLNIAFISIFALVYAVFSGRLNIDIPLLHDNLSYLTNKDFIYLYIVMFVICGLISMRYSKQLFSSSAMSVYKERD